MKKNIKATLIGEGISTIFGGFPSDMELNKKYELIYDFELRQYCVNGFNGNTYKAMSFKWDKTFQ